MCLRRGVCFESLEGRRLLSAGDLDPTFGAGGKVSSELGGALSVTVTASALQGDGKLVVVGRATRAGDPDGDFIVARYRGDRSGELDPTFGNGAGKVVIDFDRRNDTAYAVDIGPGGKIVVVGNTGDVSTVAFPPADVAIVRLLPTGELDASFDGDGRQVIDPGAGRAEARDVAVRADGSMVVGGFGGVLMIGLTPAGALDPNFGAGGKVTGSLGGRISGVTTLALDSAGRIVVGGTEPQSFNSPGLAPVARFLPDGTIDATFGNNGVRSINFGRVPGVVQLALTPAGAILAVASDFSVARLDANGALDLPYGGGDGRASAPIPNSALAVARSAAFLADGSIVVGGYRQNPSPGPSSPALVKYAPDGTPGTTFGTNGVATDGEGSVEAVHLLANQALLTVGTAPANAAGVSRAVVSRRTANGRLDGAFGPGGLGYAITNVIGPGTESVADVIPLPGGKTLAVGTHFGYGASGYDFAVQRYLPDGNQDSSFGSSGGGAAYADGGNRADVATSAVLQPDGRVLVAGRSGADLMVVRFLADGSALDPTFADHGRLVMSAIEGQALPAVFGTAPPTVQPAALALQDDGRIVVATTVGNSPKFALLRLTPEGQPDTTFGGGDGSAVLSAAGGTAFSVALDALGRIVVGGSRGTLTQPGSAFLARYTPAGALDPSFGYFGGGTQLGPASAAVTAVAVGGDGSLTAVAGPFVLRYTADGSPDLLFGNSGVTRVQFTSTGDVLRDVAVLPDGSVIAAGATAWDGLPFTPVTGDFAVAKLTAAGRPDITFGTADGTLVVHFEGTGSAANAVALDGLGRIIVAGVARVPGESSNFALARLAGSGAPGAEVEDMSLASPGWTDAFRSTLAAGAMAIGSGEGGYLLQRYGFRDVLPWVNLDRVTVRFRGPADGVGADALRVRGVNVADYGLAGFAYDPATRTATWTLGQALANDKVVVELNTDGDAEYELRWFGEVLAGDVTRDGTVNSLDLSYLKQRLNRTPAAPGTGSAAYNVFADVTGDARINALDSSAAKQRLNRRLPAANPTLLEGGGVRKELFGTAAIL